MGGGRGGVGWEFLSWNGDTPIGEAIGDAVENGAV